MLIESLYKRQIHMRSLYHKEVKNTIRERTLRKELIYIKREKGYTNGVDSCIE